METLAGPMLTGLVLIVGTLFLLIRADWRRDL